MMPATEFGYRRRNSLRYKGFDYTSAGAYFVTFCIAGGHCLFGQVAEQTMVLSPLGKLADAAWTTIMARRSTARLDAFVVMPNHVHVLVWLLADPNNPAPGRTDKKRAFGDAIAGSLSTLIGAYKSSVTQTAKAQRLLPDAPLWQDNFYDHIVRGDQELQGIRDYIHSNPARWKNDQLHPNAPANQFNRTWRSRPGGPPTS